jgi:phage gp46-like protein
MTEILGDIFLDVDDAGNGDCVFIPGGVACDFGLQTAVYISLFTDAEDTEGRTTQRGGWWDDAIDSYGSLGSRLWTLGREKMTADICARAQKYCEEALQWMLDSGAAKSVSVTATRSGLYWLTIDIDVTKPDDSATTFTYSYNWSYQNQDSY